MVSAAHPADDAPGSLASWSSSSISSSPASPAPSAALAAVPRGGRGRKGLPKPKSEKRAAANRANARKSTGPRTPEGRARSRLNALKHGLCARVVLLPGEDRAEYDAFARAFVDDLKPLGVMQEVLAGRAAALAWALQRLPAAAADLAERGEARRFERWFRGRGLGGEYDAMFTREFRGDAPPTRRADWARLADDELARAQAEGSPPPADRDPAGLMADALAGDEAFAAVLKLEEHERRLWSALLSVLRALERRQKVDGRTEGEGATDVTDDTDHAGDPADAGHCAGGRGQDAGEREDEGEDCEGHGGDAGEAPGAAGQSELEIETPSGRDTGSAAAGATDAAATVKGIESGAQTTEGPEAPEPQGPADLPSPARATAASDASVVHPPARNEANVPDPSTGVAPLAGAASSSV